MRQYNTTALSWFPEAKAMRAKRARESEVLKHPLLDGEPEAEKTKRAQPAPARDKKLDFYRGAMMQLLHEAKRRYGDFESMPPWIRKHFSFAKGEDGLTTYSILTRPAEVAEGEGMLRSLGVSTDARGQARCSFVPIVSEAAERATMDDFWKLMGWPVEAEGTWANAGVRKDAVLFLVETVLRKPLREITTDDFKNNRLWSVLDYHGSSAYNALRAAGYEINEWDMKNTPINFFTSRANRIRAIHSLVATVRMQGREPYEAGKQDFIASGLYVMLGDYYECSPMTALRDAGYDVKPWQMGRVPAGTFDKKENRVAAVQWLVSLLKKQGREETDLRESDFTKATLTTLFLNHYGRSVYAAMAEAGYEYRPWELPGQGHLPAGYFDSEEHRIAGVKFVVRKSGKEPKDVTYSDFTKARMSSLVDDHYSSSPLKALQAAGHEITETDRARKSNGYYKNSRANRVAAVVSAFGALSPDELLAVTPGEFRRKVPQAVRKFYHYDRAEAMQDAGLITAEQADAMGRKAS